MVADGRDDRIGASLPTTRRQKPSHVMVDGVVGRGGAGEARRGMRRQGQEARDEMLPVLAARSKAGNPAKEPIRVERNEEKQMVVRCDSIGMHVQASSKSEERWRDEREAEEEQKGSGRESQCMRKTIGRNGSLMVDLQRQKLRTSSTNDQQKDKRRIHSRRE